MSTIDSDKGMDASQPKRSYREAVTGGPCTWVMSMDSEDPGYTLLSTQTINAAIDDIMEGSSIALALPRVPGKSDYEIDRNADISITGAQGGMIFTQATAPATDETAKLLLLREKIRTLKNLDSKAPDIYTRILGIESKEVFLDFAEGIRKIAMRLHAPSLLISSTAIWRFQGLRRIIGDTLS